MKKYIPSEISTPFKGNCLEITKCGRFFVFGSVEGRILDAPSGVEGFGYDPLFAPQGYDRSFAELGAEIKNSLSHRGRALAQVVAWLQNS